MSNLLESGRPLVDYIRQKKDFSQEVLNSLNTVALINVHTASLALNYKSKQNLRSG